MILSMRKPLLSAVVLLLLAVLCILYLAGVFRSMQVAEPIYPGEGVTQVKLLSDWYAPLKGTAADTTVYVLEGERPGAAMLVLGGTHANEPSGVLAATVLVENARPAEGTLYVLTHTNATGFTCTDPQEAAPMRFSIDTPQGERWFRYGSRATNPIYQWPDPEMYVHASSGQQLSGSETRNLNRAYPGREDGTLTEKIAFAITELIRTENVAVTVDLHEASPEYPNINSIVAHQNALMLASDAVLTMEFEGIKIMMEASPEKLRGLSHRELGDFTDTFALLFETSNPAQGRLRGRTDERLVVTGQDKFYLKAFGYGRLYVPFDESGHPIAQRVARHLAGVVALADSYTSMNFNGDKGRINLGSLPSYNEVEQNLGAYLCPKK